MMGRRGWLASVVAGMVATGVLAVDMVVEPVVPLAQPTGTTSSTVPASGSAVCAVGDDRRGASLTVTIAGANVVAQQAASVDLVVTEEGVRDRSLLPPVFPGAAARNQVSLGHLSSVVARWAAAPVAVARDWVLEGARDMPDVTLAGPCTTGSSGHWVIPGLSTTGGEEARLRLANPHRTAATVAVSFLSPQGPEAPLILRNVSVPAGSVREIVVNETLPERADLAASVEVVSGRVVVEGYQLARSAIGGVDGGSLLLAADAAAEEWTIPWLRDNDATSSWLWIANTGERTALVELTLHTSTGGQVPDTLAEVSVPPGEQRRVDLTGTFPDGIQDVGVTVRSNGAPVVVSGAMRIAADDPEDTGISVQLGASRPDVGWVVSSSVGPAGRAERLHLVNPTGSEAVVDVQLLAGVSIRAPDALQGVTVGPGAAVVLDLAEHLDGAAAWSAFVRASAGNVVVGRGGLRLTQAEGPLRLLAGPGTPSTAWRVRGTGLVGRNDPELVHRLGSDPVDGDGRTAVPVDPVPDPEDPGSDVDVDASRRDTGS